MDRLHAQDTRLGDAHWGQSAVLAGAGAALGALYIFTPSHPLGDTFLLDGARCDRVRLICASTVFAVSRKRRTPQQELSATEMDLDFDGWAFLVGLAHPKLAPRLRLLNAVWHHIKLHSSSGNLGRMSFESLLSNAVVSTSRAANERFACADVVLPERYMHEAFSGALPWIPLDAGPLSQIKRFVGALFVGGRTQKIVFDATPTSFWQPGPAAFRPPPFPVQGVRTYYSGPPCAVHTRSEHEPENADGEDIQPAEPLVQHKFVFNAQFTPLHLDAIAAGLYDLAVPEQDAGGQAGGRHFYVFQRRFRGVVAKMSTMLPPRTVPEQQQQQQTSFTLQQTQSSLPRYRMGGAADQRALVLPMRLLVQFPSLILCEIFLYHCTSASGYVFDTVELHGFYVLDTASGAYEFKPDETLTLTLHNPLRPKRVQVVC